MIDPTIDEQIECVKREISLRGRVYPRWVEQGRMKQEAADRELNRIKAVLRTLEGQRDKLNGVE